MEAKAREKEWEQGEKKRKDAAGRARERKKEDSPGNNKPAEVEVTLKLLHG